MSRFSIALSASAFALCVIAASNFSRLYDLFTALIISVFPAFNPIIFSPLVTLDYGSFQGFYSAFNTESFLGVPFAQPPVGNLRLNKPVPPLGLDGINSATSHGHACPQIPPEASFLNDPDFIAAITYLNEDPPQSAVGASEDCLHVNVVRPGGVSAGANLPVVVFIHGGGFMQWDASLYNATDLVSHSAELKAPIVYVSFNYRLGAFGFLGGKEVQEAGIGNLGLYDQRLALEWVQKHISTFGGDPEKVVVWGQSAGGISALLHMIAYDGNLNGLFRGAVMQSGSAFPLPAITSPKRQDIYDSLVAQTNCSTTHDTLNCLRQAPYEAILDASSKITQLNLYSTVNVTWVPVVDGVILKQTIRESLSAGRYTKIPAILGSVDDEGTIFPIYDSNFNGANDQFLEFIRTIHLVGLDESQIGPVSKLYPDDPTQGSPFGIAMNDTVTPQLKRRVAAFLGDLYFQAPRRYALSIMSTTQNVWSYLWKRNKLVPVLGSFHGSDFFDFFGLPGTTDWVGADAIINFAYSLDPNAPQGGYSTQAKASLLSDFNWPRWTTESPELLTFEDPNVLTLSNDTFRERAMEYLSYLTEQMGL